METIQDHEDTEDGIKAIAYYFFELFFKRNTKKSR